MNGEAPTYYTDKHAANMELRDYFAAMAISAFIDKDQWQSSIGDIADSVAFNAYAMADAMIKAREQ